MEWTEAFKVVFAMVASVGGASAIILILSSWLVKVWKQRILSRERAELHRLAKQHEISFSQLHVERAHVIKDLYEKSATTSGTGGMRMAPGRDRGHLCWWSLIFKKNFLIANTFNQQSL